MTLFGMRSKFNFGEDSIFWRKSLSMMFRVQSRFKRCHLNIENCCCRKETDWRCSLQKSWKKHTERDTLTETVFLSVSKASWLSTWTTRVEVKGFTQEVKRALVLVFHTGFQRLFLRHHLSHWRCWSRLVISFCCPEKCGNNKLSLNVWTWVSSIVFPRETQPNNDWNKKRHSSLLSTRIWRWGGFSGDDILWRKSEENKKTRSLWWSQDIRVKWRVNHWG